jgi:mannosyltransferase
VRRHTAAGAAAALLLVAVAAALRFVGLAKQGFWYDEANTAYLVSLGPRSMLDVVPQTELTPPLYYVVAWVWVRVFGSGEAGLRSLSALAGILTVPVMYAIGRQLATHRAGLIAGALGATSPLLVWYSQEARSYALFALLSATSFLFFLRAWKEGGWADLLCWGAASALATATHYFSAFVVVPEAVLLVATRRREALIAVAASAAVAIGLAPLALHQLSTHRSAWIAGIPLSLRLRQLGEQFLAGFQPTRGLLVTAGIGLVTGAVLLVHDPPARRSAALVVIVVGCALALPFCFAALGADEVVTRNLIVVWPLLAVALAVGLAAPRPAAVGLAATALVCASWVVADVRVDRDVALQRPDWRRVLRVLGPASATRLLVLEHYPGQLPLRLYDPQIRRLRSSQSERTAEVDVIAARVPRGRACWWGSACNLSPARLPPRPPPGLHRVSVVSVPDFRIERYTSTRPLNLAVGRLKLELVHVGVGAVLLDRPRAAGT